LAAVGFAVLLPHAALAQEPTQVTGQVTAAATGQPISGVQVVVKGTTVGVVTDGNGRYSIRIPAGRSELTFSFLGYRSIDAAITGNSVNVALEVEAIGLEGVVVTALGITREKKDLGYSAQGVSGATLNAVPQPNAVSALTGHVAGVNITSATVPGGSARIIIRGNKSIAGSNEPLFIVDGMPINNINYGAGYGGGIDRGSGAADVDPNNIESITILKGPNAAALYGSLAANGAVVITTKTGRTSRGTGISASVGTTFETPLRLPKYQNLYGQGYGGEFSYVDGAGGGLNDDADASWGPRLDGRLIDQFTGPQQPWVAHPNNIRDFFELGRSTFINAAVARSGDASHVRLSVSNTNQNTMAPGNKLNTTNVALRGGIEMTERLSASGSINYIHRDGQNRPGVGYADDNIMQQFVWFGRQVDMKALKNNYLRSDGTQLNWNTNYHDNPYWMQLVNGNEDNRDRVIGSVDLTYRVNDWATALVRVGQDHMQNFIKGKWAIGTNAQYPNGGFDQMLDRRVQRNYDALLSANRELAPELMLTATAGGSVRTSEARASRVIVGSLNTPGFYSLNNAGEAPDTRETNERKQVNSLLGTLGMTYKAFSVEATARNDWSSTLPEENRSYFYPSINSAFVFTDAFDIGGSFLSSGKIRASWAQVGDDTDPYRLFSTYTKRDPFNSNPAFSTPTVLYNPNLKPMQTTSVELGTDLGFFDERLGFVLTYYDAKTTDQILSVNAPASSGATQQNINAGAVRNWGIELQMNATPIQTDNGFRWDMTLNYDRNRNEVLDLYTDPTTKEAVPAAVLQSLSWGVQVQARVGSPYGAFYGAPFMRDKATGKLLVDESGLPQRDAANQRVLGNFNADWGAGLRNTFSYKDFDLSVLVDGKMGGEIYSTTIGFGRYTGIFEETLKGRETHFYPEEDENGDVVIRCDGFVVDALYMPGTEINGADVSGQKNTTRVCPEDYWEGQFGIAESWIYDASFMKLRELRVGYRLPQSFVNRLGFSSANVAIVGRNLFLWSKAPHIDPETAYSTGNIQGLEHGQFPSGRSFGFTVSVQP
jgi:TonB-linked SusC/RagA family outer membrane protein